MKQLTLSQIKKMLIGCFQNNADVISTFYTGQIAGMKMIQSLNAAGNLQFYILE